MKNIQLRYKISFALLFTVINLSLSAQGREPPVSAEPAWQQALMGRVIGLPVLQAEAAVVVLEEGEIKSYSRFGNWLWTYDAGERLTPHITRSREGTSYICTVSGTVIAVNRVGRELWRVNLGSPITAPIVVGWDGRLFIPVGSTMYCRTASGYRLWTLDLESPIFVRPVLDRRGGLAMVLENNQFTLVSHISSREQLQLSSRPLHIVPLPASAGSDQFFLFYANGAAERIYRDNNQILTRETLPSLSQTPAAAGAWQDSVAVVLRDGRTQLLSAENGEVQWTQNSHETTAERGGGNLEPYWAGIQFDERGIYVLSARGVTGFRESDGARLWILRIIGAATIPSFGDEGYVYSGGSDGYLYAYRVEERHRNIPRSVYGPEPEGSYGLGNPPPSSWDFMPNRFAPATIRRNFAEIEAAIEAGDIGEKEPEYVAYLMEIAGISLDPNFDAVRPAVETRLRADSIRQLGYMGSRETIPFLARLFANRFTTGPFRGNFEDPEILRACSEAIGRIGVDPSGFALDAFTFRMAPENPVMDPGAQIAVANSARSLALFSGPPLADAAIRLMLRFTNPTYPTEVRNHVIALLRNLNM